MLRSQQQIFFPLVFIEHAAGRHQTSEGKNNVALFSSRLPFEPVQLFGQFPRISAGVPVLTSLLETGRQILEHTDCDHEDGRVE